MRKNEDPRLSFSTPEFKEAQRIFTDGLKVKRTRSHQLTRGLEHRLRGNPTDMPACTSLHNVPLLDAHAACVPQKNFGKPVEWGLIKDHAWSTPQLRKLDTPVSMLLKTSAVCVSHHSGAQSVGTLLCRSKPQCRQWLDENNLAVTMERTTTAAVLLAGGCGWEAVATGCQRQAHLEDVRGSAELQKQSTAGLLNGLWGLLITCGVAGTLPLVGLTVLRSTKVTKWFGNSKHFQQWRCQRETTAEPTSGSRCGASCCAEAQMKARCKYRSTLHTKASSSLLVCCVKGHDCTCFADALRRRHSAAAASAGCVTTVNGPLARHYHFRLSVLPVPTQPSSIGFAVILVMISRSLLTTSPFCPRMPAAQTLLEVFLGRRSRRRAWRLRTAAAAVAPAVRAASFPLHRME